MTRREDLLSALPTLRMTLSARQETCNRQVASSDAPPVQRAQIPCCSSRLTRVRTYGGPGCYNSAKDFLWKRFRVTIVSSWPFHASTPADAARHNTAVKNRPGHELPRHTHSIQGIQPRFAGSARHSRLQNTRPTNGPTSKSAPRRQRQIFTGSRSTRAFACSSDRNPGPGYRAVVLLLQYDMAKVYSFSLS